VAKDFDKDISAGLGALSKICLFRLPLDGVMCDNKVDP
jgi:hypothetical protein